MEQLIIKQNEIDSILKIIQDKLIEIFTCDECKKQSLTLGIHGRHMRDIHNDATSNDIWIKLKEKQKELLISKKLLKREINEIKSVRKNCPYCNKKLTLKMYQRHVNICKNNPIEKENFCKLCRIQFPTKEEYKYHLSSKNQVGCSCLKVIKKNGIPRVCGTKFYTTTDKKNHFKNHKLGFSWDNMEAYNKAHNIEEKKIDVKLMKYNLDKLTYRGIYEYIKINDYFINCWDWYETDIPYDQLEDRININIPDKYKNDLYYNQDDNCIYFVNDTNDKMVFKRRGDDDSFLPVANIIEIFKEPYVPPPRLDKVYIKCAEELLIEKQMSY